MPDNIFTLILVFSIATLIGIQAYEASGILSGIGSFSASAWIIYHLRTPLDIWESLSTLLNPFHTSVTFFLLGFTAAAFQGFGWYGSIIAATASSLIGAIFSMFIYKYWTIGD